MEKVSEKVLWVLSSILTSHPYYKINLVFWIICGIPFYRSTLPGMNCPDSGNCFSTSES